MLFSDDTLNEEVRNVKRTLVAFLFVCMMALSLAVPTMADGVVSNEPLDAEAGGENTTDTEMTQLYFRTFNGVLQFRVWSITYARWLTDWTDWNA